MNLNARTKSWIVTAALVAASVALTVFAGVSIQNMGKPNKPSESASESGTAKDPLDPSATESPSGSDLPTEPTGQTETTEPSATEPTEPSTETPPTEPPVTGTIRTLSTEEMVAIQEMYDGTYRHFTVDGDRDEQNRPSYAYGLSQEFAERFVHVRVFSDTSRNTASLCFYLEDDASYAAAILDFLKSQNIRATFFVKFDFVANHADICERILLERHELASVGSTTPSNGLAIYGLQDQTTDIMMVQDLVKSRFDYTMTKFMYLENVFTDQAVAFITQMGFELCFYSAAYNNGGSIENVSENSYLLSLEQQLHPGAVYFMRASSPATQNILPNLVYYIQQQGYQIEQLK